jgi:hypothetical protein
MNDGGDGLLMGPIIFFFMRPARTAGSKTVQTNHSDTRRTVIPILLTIILPSVEPGNGYRFNHLPEQQRLQ